MSNKKQDLILRVILFFTAIIYSINFFLETLYKFNFCIAFLIGVLEMVVFNYLLNHKLIKHHFLIFIFSPIGGMFLLLFFNNVIAVAYFLGSSIAFFINPIKIQQKP